MKNIFKTISVIAMVVMLSACKSVQVQPDSNSETSQTSLSELSNYDFNHKFEQALNRKDRGFIEKLVSSHALTKYTLKTYLREYGDAFKFIASGKKWDEAGEIGLSVFKTNIVKSLNANSTKQNWTYLYSFYDEDKNITISLYRINFSDTYQYLKFYFDENRNLVDLHISAFKYSDIDLTIKLIALSLRSANKNDHPFELINRFGEDAKNANLAKLESDLKALDEEQKKSDIIYDFLLRLLVNLPPESGKKFVSLIQENMQYQSVLLQPYLDIPNEKVTEKRISYLENILVFTQNDSRSLSELSMSYSHIGDFKSALKFGKQAVMKSPDDEHVFWNFLEVAIVSGKFDLSKKILRVLSEKFEIPPNNELLAALNKYPDFIKSQPFKTWLAENGKSTSQ
jgi:hypothetical protein